MALFHGALYIVIPCLASVGGTWDAYQAHVIAQASQSDEGMDWRALVHNKKTSQL